MLLIDSITTIIYIYIYSSNTSEYLFQFIVANLPNLPLIVSNYRIKKIDLREKKSGLGGIDRTKDLASATKFSTSLPPFLFHIFASHFEDRSLTSKIFSVQTE